MALRGALLIAAGIGVALFAFAPWREASSPPPDSARIAPASTPPASTPPAASPEAASTPPAEPDQVAAAAPPAVSGDPSGDAAAPDAATAAPEPAPAAGPSLDVARIEPDGSALFAGVATPDSEVEIRIGAQVIARARAGVDGGFVAYGVAPPGAGLQRLDLVEVDRDGATTQADAPVLIAPPAPQDPDTPADAPPTPPTLVQLRPDGAAVVQAARRPSDQPVTLDLVSYAEDGALEISGRAEGLRVVRVYANALLIAETRATADGRWTTRASAALAPGSYTLRVDAVADDGSVRGRVTSPFRREAGGLGAGPGEIVVQPGDTLWAIAENRYGSGVRYSVIYQANSARIRDPDLIFPGQVFTIPEPEAPR